MIDKLLELLMDENIYNLDETCLELKKDIKLSAIKYTAMRMKWHFYSKSEKMEKDSLRTGMHNQFIQNVKIFLRYLQKQNIDVSNLVNYIEYTDRKILGDIACKIAYEIAISER